MKILVLCTGNSCRSQMAEGFLRKNLSESDFVASAGIETHGLNPRAVKVMGEIGIDISDHESTLVSRYIDQEFDFVITVCDNARESCPIFPGESTRIHWPFDDPARAEGTEEEIIESFRRVRDEIKKTVEEWTQNMV